MLRQLNYVLAAAGIVWISGVVLALFWAFGPPTTVMGFSTRSGSLVGNYASGSVGNSRHKALFEATQRYIDQGHEVTPAMTDGTAFAPVPFLNSELERKGLKWRVRSAEGVDIVAYEIY